LTEATDLATSLPMQSPSRLVWSIALPAMLTNVATALFGLADMWVIGQLGDAAAQGAVELGAKFMMGLLIVFAFLRTATVALTAQAAGEGDHEEQSKILARSVAVALAIGAGLLLVRPWAVSAGLALLEAKGEIAQNARIYIDIRYWAGTAWLLSCALSGWLIGQRRVRVILVIEVAANILHVALDLLFVLWAGWGIAGVATATACSELFKLALLIAAIAREPAASRALAAARWRSTWDGQALRKLFSLNRDLFLRTLLLTAAMALLARSGAQQGPVVLAANGILFQIFMLSSLIVDGFESAAQVLCGEAKGRRDRGRFGIVVRTAFAWAFLTGLVIGTIYFFAGSVLAAGFSTNPDVISTTATYIGWTVLLAILGVFVSVFDGIFVGAGWTHAMVLTMAFAMAVYAGTLHLAALLGNHGVWLAFSLLFVVRALGQLYLLPGLARRDFN
jgi:multidrug resistance protein, MATE family